MCIPNESSEKKESEAVTVKIFSVPYQSGFSEVRLNDRIPFNWWMQTYSRIEIDKLLLI